MKKNKVITLLSISVLSIMLAGCNNVHFRTIKDNNNDKFQQGTVITESPKPDNEDHKDPKANSETTSTSSDDTKEPKNEPIQPVQNKELMIYSINIDTSEIEAATALVPMDSEITPQFIVDTVIDTLEDISINVGYNEVTTDGDTIFVDFRSDKAPIVNVGAGFEGAILDAIAQSLLDNLDSYSKVIYHVDGKAYASGHIEFAFDEAYLEK